MQARFRHWKGWRVSYSGDAHGLKSSAGNSMQVTLFARNSLFQLPKVFNPSISFRAIFTKLHLSERKISNEEIIFGLFFEGRFQFSLSLRPIFARTGMIARKPHSLDDVTAAAIPVVAVATFVAAGSSPRAGRRAPTPRVQLRVRETWFFLW